MKKVVTLGEILLRLSPNGHSRLEEVHNLEVNFGGSEYNIAVALSGYGVDVSFITRLPNNDLGKAARKQMNRYGINSSDIINGGDRMGIYFLENGYSIRPTKVVYDRKDTSMATLNISEFDIDSILEGADIFHVSGITLGISEQAAELAKIFMMKAKEKDIKVSFDFNYRSKIWTLKEATVKYKMVLPYVDILFGNHLDFCNLLEKKPENLNEVNIKSYYQNLYIKMEQTYNIPHLVTSIRDVKTASNNDYQGILYYNNQIYCSKKYSIDIIDRVGTGDAFSAGYLYSYLANKKAEETIEFAVASSVFKHTIPGDVTIANVKEIEDIVNNQSFGVQR
ncbi:sugar kinase [Gracilibacillus massiliensis]|uniref:sugar kinase n=1 Tax=Gracilibacillus massiliensis TaxID=1564956 RepID=UPI00071DDBDA|nr:sugar kinase [Gracilibacillus massiliensis]